MQNQVFNISDKTRVVVYCVHYLLSQNGVDRNVTTIMRLNHEIITLLTLLRICLNDAGFASAFDGHLNYLLFCGRIRRAQLTKPKNIEGESNG